MMRFDRTATEVQGEYHFPSLTHSEFSMGTETCVCLCVCVCVCVCVWLGVVSRLALQFHYWTKSEEQTVK